MSRGNMRSQMPQAAAFIDDLRAAFGAGEIDDVIRRGLHRDSAPDHRFFACEAGHQLGQRYVPEGTVISGSQMMVAIKVAETANEPRKRGRYR